ncbi:MAG: 3-phosphoshikimate 1-carboxyvinyltransferase [Chloroflexota bacterium]|nr:3-phosphoshikimate 1-carboxyvinyltransferase [Chloroflexota bacterium]
MKACIQRSEVRGTVIAPSSKSYTIRGLMGAALARGESEIIRPLSSEDTEAAMSVLSKIGVRVRQEDDLWRVSGGNFHQPDTDLFCGDSAATLRFMTAICAIVPGKCRLTAGPSLSRRPVKPLIAALQQLGIKCAAPGGLPPVTVTGGGLKGGVAELPGDISSQFVSALLFLAPFAEESMIVRLTTPLESKPYVMMTLDCLQRFSVTVGFSPVLDQFEVVRQNYEPTKYEVEGDWSSASYFLALGALAGEVAVNNLNPASLQGDKIMINFLQDMGADIEVGQGSVTVRKSKLKALRTDLTDCIDLLPTVAVLAAIADGVSELTGIARARLKESDRVAAVKDGLIRMGISVTEERDKLTITGSKPRGAMIDCRGDHRLAMAFSVLGIAVGNTVIDDAECVAKTYPQFWDELKSIGGEVSYGQ